MTQKSRKQRSKNQNAKPRRRKIQPKIKVQNSLRKDYYGNPYLREDLIQEQNLRYNFAAVSDKDTYNYVHFFDGRDSYLKRMYNAIDNSPTLQSIISKKNAFVLGKGFIAEPKDNNLIQNEEIGQELDNKQVDQLNGYLKEVNSNGENINDILAPLINDYNSFGNCYLEFVKSNDSVHVFYRPFHEVRLKEVQDRTESIRYCVVNRNFDTMSGVVGTAYKPFVVPLYPNFGEINGQERSILHLKRSKAGLEYYGLPSWVSAILWAEIEYKVAKYSQSEFDNGFMPSALIQMYAQGNNDQIQEALDLFSDEQTGTGNQAQIFTMLLENGTEPAKVDLLSQKREGSYMNTLEYAERKIMQSESWSDALMGNKAPGELGGSQNLRTELEYKYQELILPIQQFLSKRLLGPIIKEFFATLNQESNISLKFVKNIPVTLFGEIDVQSVLSTDELREELDKQPLEDGNINE